MSTTVYAFAGGSAAALVGLIVSDAKKNAAGVWFFKPLASVLFVAAALANGAWGTDFGKMIAVGLVLGAVGDVLLIPRSQGFFLAGLVSFLAGHVLYAVAFAARGIDLTHTAIAAVVMLLPAILIGRWLLPHVERKMKGPVLVYMAVISAMVALAYGTLCVRADGAAVLLGAAIAFYASDLCVARDQFVKRGPENRIVGLPLYYGAQIAFALSVAG
jgi:uncharacterized membrane protein YhhN